MIVVLRPSIASVDSNRHSQEVGHVCVAEVAGIRSQGAKQVKENVRDVCGELRGHSDFRLSISMTPMCLRMNIYMHHPLLDWTCDDQHNTVCILAQNMEIF